VNQLATAMEAHGLVRGRRDPRDDRGGFSSSRRLAGEWPPLSPDLGGNPSCQPGAPGRARARGHDLLASLGDLEELLDQRDMHARVTDASAPAGGPSHASLPRERLEIVPYRPAWRRHFERLNREWLEKRFVVEPPDAALLEDPYRTIVKRGRRALRPTRRPHRRHGALIRHGEGVYELAKMAVTEPCRGRGIGRKLCEATLEERESAERDPLLETSPRLVAVRRWYQRIGFRRVARHPLGASKYARRSFAMVLDASRLAREVETGAKPSSRSGRPT